VRFANAAVGGLWNIYVDNIAASWLRAPTTIANFDKAKALHKYTVEWNTGFIRTKIDDKIVDYRRYAGRLPFYLDKFKAHVTSGYGLHEEYAVMFGAQCDNESNFHEGCLDLIPGGTMENEGSTGHLISRNDGVYTLENIKDTWDWANLSFWKRLSLNASSMPVLSAARDIHDDLIEYCKTGASFYSLARNNVENYNKTHAGAQVGSKNTDLETYGKFFSLFANDHTADADKASMALFDVYTFTNGKISSTFKFSVLGLVGSLARLFGVYAVQLSEIADMQSLVHNTALVANKTGYELKLSYSSVGPKDAIDLGEERTLVANELLVRRNKPSVAEFKELLSLIFGLDEEYIRFTESESVAQVTVLIPYPQPDGLFNQLSWKQYLSNFIEKFRTLGITFIYSDFVFVKSENASGKWSESYAQVLIS
jgi:hypothetical protein